MEPMMRRARGPGLRRLLQAMGGPGQAAESGDQPAQRGSGPMGDKGVIPLREFETHSTGHGCPH